jgi:hypothetical protein
MERILFVTGSAGGVGVETLHHRGTLRKSNGASRNVLNSSLMKAVTMFPPSDDLHNVLFANKPDAIPDENNITVQGILEKSQTTGASEPTSDTDGLQANVTDALVMMFGNAKRYLNATQPMR